MSITTDTTRPPATLTITAWRDHDPAACELPGMLLGQLEVQGGGSAAVRQLWDQGARRVELPGVVDLTDPAAAVDTVRTLCLIRDLTARAVYVDWRLRTGPDPEAWLPLNHLHPPLEVEGPPDPEEVVRQWRDGHYLCKCIWRNGPGFVQIRDRRWGELHRFTAEEPHYHRAITLLEHGAPAAELPAEVLADFREERLIGEVGELAWWLPYRIQRWIHTAMVV
ncbi:DUF5825 family protein [Streptomyces sp. RKAG293]|uniref:DUF5825 family protein n=1 Tax=Streptomyces sp. RKAG293 TaxID=2893403 RepID=UPI0035A8F8BF